MNNKQWTMNNEQWTINNKQWTMNNEQRTMINKQQTINNEQWAMSNECNCWSVLIVGSVVDIRFPSFCSKIEVCFVCICLWLQVQATQFAFCNSLSTLGTWNHGLRRGVGPGAREPHRSSHCNFGWRDGGPWGSAPLAGGSPSCEAVGFLHCPAHAATALRVNKNRSRS